jgi:hypothetical protein
MSDTPTLTGQDIGQAERATRAVFDRFLAETATTFDQWVTLNVLAAAESPVERDELLGRLTARLRIPELTAHAAIDEVTSGGLVAASGDLVRLGLSPEGTRRVQAIRQGIAQIAARLYGDLPAHDLATTHRVLATVTERANAELVAD